MPDVPLPDQSTAALHEIAENLRNIRKGVDWNAPPPRILYAALRSAEADAREALGEERPQDFCHKGRFTVLPSASDEERHGG